MRKRDSTGTESGDEQASIVTADNIQLVDAHVLSIKTHLGEKVELCLIHVHPMTALGAIVGGKIHQQAAAPLALLLPLDSGDAILETDRQGTEMWCERFDRQQCLQSRLRGSILPVASNTSYLELGAVKEFGVFLFVQHGFADQLLRAWDGRAVGGTEVGETLEVARVLRVKDGVGVGKGSWR